MKHRKIIFFIKIKFIIELSNLFVHSCWRINLIVLSDLTKVHKYFQTNF